MSVQIVQKVIRHAPGDKRAYGIDCTDELQGQTINTAVWVATGLTKSLETIDGNVAQLYLAGGADGTDYVVSCTITTSSDEIFTRSILLECRKL